MPPELVGAHLGGPVAHTTGRSHRLGFRAATALLGHFGIEWDLRGLRRRASATRWRPGWRCTSELRPLVAAGRLVRGDHPDPAVLVTGRGRQDRAEAWYVVATVDTLGDPVADARCGCPGSTRSRTLPRHRAHPPGERHVMDLGESWVDGDGIEVSGSAAGRSRCPAAVTAPQSARVLRATAVG